MVGWNGVCCAATHIPHAQLAVSQLGKPSRKKKCFLLGIAQITSPPPSPQFGQLVPLFFKRQKRRFKRHSKAETKNNAKSDKKVNYYQKHI